MIVRGDRPDVQMSALGTDMECFILTNGLEPIEYVKYEADEEEVSIVIVDIFPQCERPGKPILRFCIGRGQTRNKYRLFTTSVVPQQGFVYVRHGQNLQGKCGSGIPVFYIIIGGNNKGGVCSCCSRCTRQL